VSGPLETPRDERGVVDYSVGWTLWSDMVRFYPSGVHRRRLVCDWLAPYSPGSILDAGCGAGHLLAALHQRFPSARLTGCDYAARTVEENRARLPWARFEQLDLARSGLPEQFDAVTCSEVLEHVDDDRAALAHLAAMTRRALMITVPTGPRFPLEQGFGHLRHYQLEPFCRSVEATGLRVVRARAWGFPWMNLFKRVTNLRPQATLDGFGAGEWSWPKKAIGAALTGLFYLNLPAWGPQLLVLAAR
jgi:SAM-dependent methyltransferase